MMRYLRSRSRPLHLRHPASVGHRAKEAEPVPDWVVLRDRRRTDRLIGLYHLKRRPPALSTLCGMEKGGWQSMANGLGQTTWRHVLPKVHGHRHTDDPGGAH